MAKNRLLEAFNEARSISRQEMPEAENMQMYLDIILPQVRQWSEDLREEHFYVGRSWLEFRDDDGFHDQVLHFFNEGGEYIRIENGDVSNGSWRLMDAPNRMILDYESTEMFELSFMNENFFILQKHGDQVRLGREKYFVMLNERLGKRLQWPDAMELLYRVKYEHSRFYQTLTVIILVIVVIILIYSLI